MKGWKTIIFNVVTAILLLASQLGEGWGISPVIIGYVMAIGNFILRFLTTTPVGKSQ